MPALRLKYQLEKNAKTNMHILPIESQIMFFFFFLVAHEIKKLLSFEAKPACFRNDFHAFTTIVMQFATIIPRLALYYLLY